MGISVYDSLIKRLPGYINTASKVLQDILTVIANKISELDAVIKNASEVNQSKKRLMQILKEWNIYASPVCSVENLQNALRHRYEYHLRRGSEEGILNDIDLLCNSGANICKEPPFIEWYLDINYPFWGESEDESPSDYNDGCYGYLIDLGLVIRFAIDNNALTENEIKEILRKNSIPIHIDVILDVTDDSYNYLMLEKYLNLI